MLSFLRNHKTALPAIALLIMTILACGGTSTAIPATEAASSLAGRLLLLQKSGRPYELMIAEFISGSETPKVLWSDLPGNLPSLPSSKEKNYTIDPIVSPDGKYAVLPNSLAIVNLGTGDNEEIPLPDGVRGGENGDTFLGAFSPDSRYLAFALSGREQNVYAPSGLYLLEMSAATIKTLFDGPCEQYTGLGTVCGGVGYPLWIDETTLVYSSYVGEMPEDLTYIANPVISSNRTTILTIDGTILHEFEQPLGVYARGQTVVIYSENGAAWLEAADFKKGETNGTAIDSGIQLSPDGQFAYFGEQGKLVELRTGSTTTVAPHSLTARDHVFWSPVSRHIAIWNEISNELTIISLEGEPAELLIDMDGWLLDWVP